MRTDDLNAWLNWAIYAVAGKLNEADAVMNELGSGVRRVAAELCRRFPLEPRPTYRGLLLEPWRVPEGAVVYPDGRPHRSDSWSEDVEVARWFADPRGTLAQFVVEVQPEVVGWLARRASPRPDEVFFHWSWAEELPVRLEELAAQHPLLDHAADHAADQVEWNLATQKEVVLLPVPYAVSPWFEIETDRLEERLCFPSARRSGFKGWII